VNNRTLGRFHLDGIPPAPRGLPQIEVTFDIDANGIVNVTAKDKATSREQKITITASSGLDKQQVEQMVHEASEHEDEDKARRETVEARNRADSLAYQVERTLKENEARVPEAEAAEVRQAIEEIRSVLDSEDKVRLQSAEERLTRASHKMAEALYRSSAAGSAAGTGGEPGGGDGRSQGKGAGDTVIDAEFTEPDKN